MGHLREKYTRDYLLGSIDETTQRKYGVAGTEAFLRGRIDERYMVFLRRLNVKDKRILDIGCGRGEVVRYCAMNGAKEAVGIDFSPAAIEIASALNQHVPNTNLIMMEAKDISFENHFDVVFCLDVIEHIPDEEMQLVYPRIYTCLRSDGLLIVDTPLFSSADALDDSDLKFSTKGMHCNKQTRRKLIYDIGKNGFKGYSPCVWSKSQRFSGKLFLYALSVTFLKGRRRITRALRHPLRSLAKLVNKIGDYYRKHASQNE